MCVCGRHVRVCILNVVFGKEVNPLTIIATNVCVTVHTMPVVLLLHVQARSRDINSFRIRMCSEFWCYVVCTVFQFF